MCVPPKAVWGELQPSPAEQLRDGLRELDKEESVNEQDIVISEAVNEYDTHGIVSTTTYMALTSVGLDADAIIADIEDAS